MAEPVKLMVVGCGGRGRGYAKYVKEHPEEARIVAVAEPDDFYRNQTADEHDVPENRRFRSWEEAVRVPKLADGVMICTQDAMHEEPAIAFAGLGYHILLEKPMAPTPESCRRIVAAVKAAGVMFGVCHVLRYTPYTTALKKLLNSGAIGEVVSIQHLEPVGHAHQAHSFVRGHWRNEQESSFMLLAKCCHDLDWLNYVMGGGCREVQSFGFLKYFNRAHQPAGAADRCLDCPAVVEYNCPYSALKIYLRDQIDRNYTGWPVNVLTTDTSREGVLRALREGPYGRCVFACDNDVVDNQIVNLNYSGDRTVAMTMTAFCDDGGRQTRIFGTRGCINTDSNVIRVTDFLVNRRYEIDTNVSNDGSIVSGHGGGDGGLMQAFVAALASGDRSKILSGADESLESHLMVFAAEKSRRTGQVIKMD